MRYAILLALFIESSALSQGAQAANEAQQTIVVTGTRIQDYRDRLASCIARRCPTNEDADATLALAEVLFLEGEYRESRDILRASLGRNSRNATAFPEPVSDLYRAHARLSRHLGFDDDAKRSAFGILRSLRQGIPQEDHRHFTARFEISELLMLTGNTYNYRVARRELEDLVRISRAAGREDVAIMAELRILLYDEMAFPGEGRARLLQIVRQSDSDQNMRVTGARILLARIYRSEGDIARSDAMIAQVRNLARSGATRRLLYSPMYHVLVNEAIAPGAVTDLRRGEFISSILPDFENKWMDVGFWVMPDGHTSGVEVVRQGSDPWWAASLLSSIRGRLYSEGDAATYRLERYSLTANYGRNVGRLSSRSVGIPRVEYFDLTSGASPPIPPQPN